MSKLFLSFHLYLAEKRYSLFVDGCRCGVDGSKDISFLKSAWSILYSELKAHVLLPIEGNSEGSKTTQKLHCTENEVFH